MNTSEIKSKLDRLSEEAKKLQLIDGDRSIISVGLELYNVMSEEEKRDAYLQWFYNKVTRDIIFRAPETMFEEWRCLCEYLEENFLDSPDAKRISKIISNK